jgi:hypothetical protein
LLSSAGALICPNVFLALLCKRTFDLLCRSPHWPESFLLPSFAEEPLLSSAGALICPNVFFALLCKRTFDLLCKSPHWPESVLLPSFAGEPLPPLQEPSFPRKFFFQTSQPHSDHRLLHLKPLQHIRRECLYRQQSASPATHFRNSAAPIFVPIIPTQGWLAPLPAQL